MRSRDSAVQNRGVTLSILLLGSTVVMYDFGIACIITIIIAQAMVNVGLPFAWTCMCLMNTLDDCDLLEKVVNITNVYEQNDVTVSKYNNSESMFIIIVLNRK